MYYDFVSVPYEITLLSNRKISKKVALNVSVPYEITLLSNCLLIFPAIIIVSVPYEITLLSNTDISDTINQLVSVPYEITLLSNMYQCLKISEMFQYLMKLHYSQTSNKLRHYNAQGNNIRYIYYTI